MPQLRPQLVKPTQPAETDTTTKQKLAEVLSPKPPSLSHSAGSKNYQRALRLNTIYLQGLLPQGSQNLFTPRQYGNHLGVPIVCPHCEEKPPRHIPPYGRWRWLTFHLATRHRGGR